MEEFTQGHYGRRRVIENSIPKKCWHGKEFKKIVDYVASGDSLHVELSKDAIDGTLKIGDEIIPVYMCGIDLKNISLDCEPVCETSDGKIRFPKTKIVREFVLREK